MEWGAGGSASYASAGGLLRAAEGMRVAIVDAAVEAYTVLVMSLHESYRASVSSVLHVARS